MDKKPLLEFRPMKVEDLEDVINIENELFQKPFSREMFRSLISNEYCKLIVATVGQEIIGYVIYTTVIDETDLLNIAVTRDMQRKGVGKALLNYLFEDIKKRVPKAVVFLEARRSNLGARKLYEYFDFVKIGERRGYYSDNNEDAMIYMKEV